MQIYCLKYAKQVEITKTNQKITYYHRTATNKAGQKTISVKKCDISDDIVLCHPVIALKPIFHLTNLFARTHKKVGILPTCLRRIFSSANFYQSRCRILVFASRRASNVAKWKIGLIKAQVFDNMFYVYQIMDHELIESGLNSITCHIY